MQFSAGRRTRPPVLLLIDDDPADQELARRILARSEHGTKLHAVESGEAALAYLREPGDSGLVPRPDLVIVDLNMPQQNGIEVVRAIRADPKLRDLVVVVLSTSDRDTDVDASYGAGANSFIAKPAGSQAVERVMRQIEDYWFGVVALPEWGSAGSSFDHVSGSSR